MARLPCRRPLLATVGSWTYGDAAARGTYFDADAFAAWADKVKEGGSSLASLGWEQAFD